MFSGRPTWSSSAKPCRWRPCHCRLAGEALLWVWWSSTKVLQFFFVCFFPMPFYFVSGSSDFANLLIWLVALSFLAFDKQKVPFHKTKIYKSKSIGCGYTDFPGCFNGFSESLDGPNAQAAELQLQLQGHGGGTWLWLVALRGQHLVGLSCAEHPGLWKKQRIHEEKEKHLH